MKAIMITPGTVPLSAWRDIYRGAAVSLDPGAYAAIDLSQWIAGNPAYLLADHLGKPAEFFQKFPKRDVFIAPGS